MYQTPKGTRDTEPKEMIRVERVISTFKEIARKYGFDPLDTPAFEDWLLLSAKSGGGEAIKDEIYYFKDKGNRELGLRFDFTVPLARFIASNPSIPKPFKRYQIGKVWRYDNPGFMRWREFRQADIDIVGSQSMEAEAECIRVVCEFLEKLGFGIFFIRLSNRKIIEDFLRSLGILNIEDVFRSIDKLEKIGEREVEKELESKGVIKENIEAILEFIKFSDLGQIKKKCSSEGIEELEEILSMLSEYSSRIQVDMSLVRGLDYYTGSVFEISLGSGISIGGGGRYDNLVGILGGKQTPCVGISIGIDRLVASMEERKMFSLPETYTKIFVASAGEESKKEAISISQELRKLGISTEFDLMSRSLSKQLHYSNAKRIPFLLVIGENEIKSGVSRLRNMQSGEEKEVSIKNLKEIVKAIEEYSNK